MGFYNSCKIWLPRINRLFCFISISKFSRLVASLKFAVVTKKLNLKKKFNIIEAKNNENMCNKKNYFSLSLKKSQYCSNMNTLFELKKIPCKINTRVRKCKVYLCLKPIQKAGLQESQSGI